MFICKKMTSIEPDQDLNGTLNILKAGLRNLKVLAEVDKELVGKSLLVTNALCAKKPGRVNLVVDVHEVRDVDGVAGLLGAVDGADLPLPHALLLELVLLGEGDGDIAQRGPDVQERHTPGLAPCHFHGDKTTTGKKNS